MQFGELHAPTPVAEDPLARGHCKGRRTFLITSATFAICLVAYAVAHFGPGSDTVDITVTVVDKASGEAIRNADVLIATSSYNLLENYPRDFIRRADADGKLSFRQRIDYSPKSVGVNAMDPEKTRFGVSSRQAYWLQDLLSFELFDRKKHVLFSPTRGHIRVEIAEGREADRKRGYGWPENEVIYEEATIERLAKSGIEVQR